MASSHLPLALLLSFVLCASFALGGFPAGDFVVELNDTYFERAVKGRHKLGFYLVEFYSPTCGHCRAFAPTFEAVGDSLRSIIPVGRLSVHEYRDLTAKYNVKGVPHVALFLPQNENPIVYQDDRTAKDIVAWVLGAMVEFEMPLKEVHPDDVEAFVNAKKKIHPSRYLMINQGATPLTWNLIYKRVGNRAIFGHLNSDLIQDLPTFQARYNISRLPAIVAHMKHKDSDAADAPSDIITFQGSLMLSAVQKALGDEGAFGVNAGPDNVDTEGLILPDSGSSEGFDLNKVGFFASALFFCVCVVGVLYKNRNKKVKEVVPDLEAVKWEVGGKKALD